MNYKGQPLQMADPLKNCDWWLTHTSINTVCIHKSRGGIFTDKMTQEASLICVCFARAGSLCSSMYSGLPSEAWQSQHSLAIGLSSWRDSFPQQLKQRPSSFRIWRAGHTVQFHMLGPRQSRQDGSHALQFGLSLWDTWNDRRVVNTF